jgi:Mismatch repair ATPase (MutS family)
MSVHQYYSSQVHYFQEELEKYRKKENTLSLLRLVSFVFALVLFYAGLTYSVLFATGLLFAGLVVFGIILKKHLAVKIKVEYLSNRLKINQKEFDCLNGNFSSFPDGKEYQDMNHPYSGDLDIFGKASLFQYINRTSSKPGSDLLADWLKSPAGLNEIAERQAAIAELKDLVDWRQDLVAISYKYADAQNNPNLIIDWLREEPVFSNKKTILFVINVLSVVTIGALAGWLAGLSVAFISTLVAVNFFFISKLLPKINKVHHQVSKTSELLKSFYDSIQLIEKQNFKSEKLNRLQRNFVHKNGNASDRIKQLANLVNKLDYRLNVIVSVLLNLFYFWDVRQVLRLVRWKEANREEVLTWFKTMAEFEALCSFANLYYNNPEWVMPSVDSAYFHLDAEEAGHPLIPQKRRVCNSLYLERTGKMVIVTGSNMSGKSTFLRTIGVNLVLALAGAPVCSKKFETSLVKVLSSMRIADSLEENTSSFYAELKRLAGIIKAAENQENVFLLLDEILRGTNSNDRHIGSVALIRQLIKSKAAGILATHDLALSHLEHDMPQVIDNYNFDVKIENEELFFDYKLEKGICKSLNASILMKKMGIEIIE